MDRRAVFKELRNQGWSLEKTKNNHWKITNPAGRSCFTGSTPGDKRAVRNLMADLRRLGFSYETDTKGRR